MRKETFIYQDAKGLIGVHTVVNITETHEYFQGHSEERDSFRIYRKDRVLEHVNNYNNKYIESRLAHYLADPPPIANLPVLKYDAIDICFTGFLRADKKELIELAESKGMEVRVTVAKKLDFLCYGYNAGPTKLRKARDQGTTILSENQLRVALKTGEIPEEE